jgi:B-cell receptor-associated protein 31
MSFQWGCAAMMLYGELAVTFVLCVPYISNNRWHKLFKLKLLQSLASTCLIMFYCAVVFLFVLLIDSTRETMKYQDQAATHDVRMNPMGEHEIHLKMFRAQRNFYISGVALFLLVVIYRLVKLITTSAQLQLNHEAVKRQADNANVTAQAFLEENCKLKAAAATAGRREDVDAQGDDAGSEQSSLKEAFARLQKEAKESNEELEATKTKVTTLETAYDTLMAENKKLQQPTVKKDE